MILQRSLLDSIINKKQNCLRKLSTLHLPMDIKVWRVPFKLTCMEDFMEQCLIGVNSACQMQQVLVCLGKILSDPWGNKTFKTFKLD